MTFSKFVLENCWWNFQQYKLLLYSVPSKAFRMPPLVFLHIFYDRIMWFTLGFNIHGFAANRAVVPDSPFRLRKIIAIYVSFFVGWFRKGSCPLNMCEVILDDSLYDPSIWHAWFLFDIIQERTDLPGEVNCDGWMLLLIPHVWWWSVHHDPKYGNMFFNVLIQLTVQISDSVTEQVQEKCISIHGSKLNDPVHWWEPAMYRNNEWSLTFIAMYRRGILHPWHPSWDREWTLYYSHLSVLCAGDSAQNIAKT